MFRILYRDESLVAIDKPAGFHIHPPEDPAHRIQARTNTLHVLSRQLGHYLYPVHRIDRATSGVVLFALTREAAAKLGEDFRGRRITKRYVCVVRGWLEGPGAIDRPLKPESGTGEPLEARTSFMPVGRIELPAPEGSTQHPTARYSLVVATPFTGRFHQLRRHFAGISHPMIGDSVHGHGVHNRYFKNKLGLPGLWLKAAALEFKHPLSGERVRVASRWDRRWHRMFERFGVCPYLTTLTDPSCS